MSGSRLALFKPCSCENGVHRGDPTMQKGSLSLIRFITLAWIFRSDKSHGFPVEGSLVDKSRLHPGLKVVPSNFCAVASWHILGLEYISATSGLDLMYRSWAPVSTNSTRMSSGSGSSRLRMLSADLSNSHSSIRTPRLKSTHGGYGCPRSAGRGWSWRTLW